MGTDTTPALDHIILIKGPQRRQYEQRGLIDGQVGDLLLIRGVPEPLTSFAESAFAERLIEDKIAARCTADGHLEDGTQHPDVKTAVIVTPVADAALPPDSGPNGLSSLPEPLTAAEPSAPVSSPPSAKKKP